MATNPCKAQPKIPDKTQWSSFLADIIPFVSSPNQDYRRAPDDVIIHYVKQAAQYFAQDSTLLRDKFCFDLECGVSEIPFIIPDDRELIHIHQLMISGEAASLCGNAGCLVKEAGCHGCGSSDTQYSVIGFRHDEGSHELKLPFTPASSVQNGFCATYSYTQKFENCSVPEAFQGLKWRRAIIAYTLKLLYGMKDMNWGDKAYFGKYEQDSAYWAAKGRAFASNQGVTQRQPISKRMADAFWS
jgi:hypothetical protein